LFVDLIGSEQDKKKKNICDLVGGENEDQDVKNKKEALVRFTFCNNI